MKYVVLFDVDGTLMEESPTHTRAFDYVCDKFFHVKTNIESFPRHGMTDQGILYGILHNSGIDNDAIKSRINELLNELGDYTIQNMKKYDYELLPFVKETLEEMKNNNFILGLITGNFSKIALERVSRAGIGNYFSFGGYGEDSTERSDLVQRAIERSKMNSDPKNVFVIGDTPKDIMAGKDAGTKTVGIATGVYGIEQLLSADFSLKNLNEYKKLIEFIKK